MLPAYNFSPSPTNYSPVFGGVPGPVAPAPSIYDQVGGAVPNLPQLTGAASNVISNELAGKLSPEALSAIKDQSAIFGLGSGMPGSGLAANQGLRNLGLTTEQTQQQGIGDYLKFLSGIGSTQTNPAITQDLAQWNATNQAAPNPAAAEEFMQGLLKPQTPANDWSHPMPDYFTPAGSSAKLPLGAGYSGF